MERAPDPAAAIVLSLPRDEYPTIVALAEHLTEDAQDELFQFGIDMCLRGIEILATSIAR